MRGIRRKLLVLASKKAEPCFKGRAYINLMSLGTIVDVPTGLPALCQVVELVLAEDRLEGMLWTVPYVRVLFLQV